MSETASRLPRRTDKKPEWADVIGRFYANSFDATNRADVIGSIGNATATLDGSTLTVHGTFANLKSPATTGSFRIGLAKGVPGDAIGTLTVERARQGAFSGTIKLSPAQLSALNRQSLYVRIDNEKSPDGNLQGWLEESGKDHVS